MSTIDSGIHRAERLSRFVRHRFGKPPFVPQPRDHEIVRVVSQHRVISSDDLQVLIAGSNQTILRRLQKLFHHGYLDRPRSQRQLGNVPMVYALGQRGADLLAGSGTRSDWSEKNRQLGSHYLEHSLMVSRFQAALRHAVSQQGTISIERWDSDGAIRDAVVIEHQSSKERIPIAPDAFFVLRVDDGPRSGRVHVFLEADRGTMTVKRFVTKTRGYWHYWRSGRQEQLGIRNFLVLTITRTPERAASLRRATAELDAPRHRGLRMFLFGSERNYSLPEPLRILESIWASAEDQGRHSLLE